MANALSVDPCRRMAAAVAVREKSISRVIQAG
jgi:hypothetical protein